MHILYINVGKIGRKSKEMVNIKIWKTLTLGNNFISQEENQY